MADTTIAKRLFSGWLPTMIRTIFSPPRTSISLYLASARWRVSVVVVDSERSPPLGVDPRESSIQNTRDVHLRLTRPRVPAHGNELIILANDRIR